MKPIGKSQCMRWQVDKKMLNRIIMESSDFDETASLCAWNEADSGEEQQQLHSIDNFKSIKAHIYYGLTEHQRFISSSLSSCHRVNDEAWQKMPISFKRECCIVFCKAFTTHILDAYSIVPMSVVPTRHSMTF